ncbi:hypothetical protein ACHAWF_002378 [Thalassiosira exigua]
MDGPHPRRISHERLSLLRREPRPRPPATPPQAALREVSQLRHGKDRDEQGQQLFEGVRLRELDGSEGLRQGVTGDGRGVSLGFYGAGCPHVGVECLIAQVGKLWYTTAAQATTTLHSRCLLNFSLWKSASRHSRFVFLTLDTTSMRPGAG